MDPDADPGLIALQREQLAARMPSFQDSDLTAAWIGPYDITPDWNPVVGGLPGVDGLTVTYGFSGHGFKLAPALGRSLAQGLLSRAPDVDLTPYRFERFAEDDLLIGAYGVGSIS